jgi:hypothetical protein
MLIANLSDGGIKQFAAKAAENLAALDAEYYFRSRVVRSDLAAFDRIMSRADGGLLCGGVSGRGAV